jgi:succinoglycan biosynthesis protein ExoA
MIEISVVMPVRNEESFIERVIDSLAFQTRGLHYYKLNVIIVDGRSNDKTTEIAFKKLLELESDVFNGRVLTNISGDNSAPSNFNLGYSLVNTEYIFRLDGHSVLSKNYLEQCIDTFLYLQKEKECPIYVSGQVEHINSGQSYLSQGIPLAMNNPYVTAFSWRSVKSLGIIEVETAVFFLTKKKYFEIGGCYDLDMKKNEDDLHSFIFRKNGGKIFLTSDCKLSQIARTSLYALAKQYFSWGRYKLEVIRRSRALPRKELIFYLFLTVVFLFIFVLYGFGLILPIILIELIGFLFIYKYMFFSVYIATWVMRLSYLFGIIIGVTMSIKRIY